MKTRFELMTLKHNITEYTCEYCEKEQATELSGHYGETPLCKTCANEYRNLRLRFD